jgi:hypothetical protein
MMYINIKKIRGHNTYILTVRLENYTFHALFEVFFRSLSEQPLDKKHFISHFEGFIGQILSPKKRGRKLKNRKNRYDVPQFQKGDLK